MPDCEICGGDNFDDICLDCYFNEGKQTHLEYVDDKTTYYANNVLKILKGDFYNFSYCENGETKYYFCDTEDNNIKLLNNIKSIFGE